MDRNSEERWQALLAWLRETGYKPEHICDIVMDKMLYDLGCQRRFKANGFKEYDPEKLEEKISVLETATF